MNLSTPRVNQRRMLSCVLYGFASGLPFYVLVSLVPAWLRTQGVGLAAIASLSWARLPYSWKFLWAPLVDRIHLPLLGRRRDWTLAMQLGLAVLVAALGWVNPKDAWLSVSLLCLAIALFSATQDIAIDAYRRELLAELELGLGNSLAVNAYRVSGVVAGGLALYLADRLPWRDVYLIVAGFMLVGVLASVASPDLEPEAPPEDLKRAILDPFREFFGRGDLRSSMTLLAFLVLYKLGDNLATSLVTTFYLDMGFSLTEIGTLVKGVSLWSMIAGSILGGVIMTRIGINRALWLFGIVQMVSILGFLGLALVGHDRWFLAGAVMFEYFGMGLGTTAFVAFLARSTARRYSATQYAAFSSVVALPGIAVGSVAGLLVEGVGYPAFFGICTALALPGLWLLPRVAPWHTEEASPSS
jgi:MFS transporter, PAT family, beta-lactamase induction signal transducer AmpG